jgi:tRNA A37 threonylcarbamoyladenosine dehydratase
MSFTAYFNRTSMLIGEEGMERLRQARIAIFGLGGVGSYVAEALGRLPVGHLLLVDRDTVQPSNLNRQLPATVETLGLPKAAVVAERLKSVNPELEVDARHEELRVMNIDSFLNGVGYDYVVDAVDMVVSKVALLAHCYRHKIPLVSSMGAARRLDPARVKVADIAKTRDCPLARDVRKRLRKLGIHKGITVVYSDEEPLLPGEVGPMDEGGAAEGRGPISGSISYMPALFGLHCAAVVVRGLLDGMEFPARGVTRRRSF